MRNLLLVLLFLLPIRLFSQSKFVIEGKTNVLVNGKVILRRLAPGQWYPLRTKDDTVPVRNHLFMFTGMLKYPEGYRIYILGKKDTTLTEPFFISAGIQKMTINERSIPHDMTEIGVGLTMQNAPANDEYTKRYLPFYAPVNKLFDHYADAVSKCNSLKNDKAKKGCEVAVAAERANLKKSSDNVLLTYAKTNPKSPVVPWLLYFKVFINGYRDAYQGVFNAMAPYTPANINVPISTFLAKQKLKAPGYPFPLTDFVKANVSRDISKNRYMLVDFWFSGCGPCIMQFGELKSIYKKFNKKGFEIIAVSVDQKRSVPMWKKIIQKNGYPWVQVLDLNGVKTNTIDINSFPTSFLLDSNWKIITTRTDPYTLNHFLEDNLR